MSKAQENQIKFDFSVHHPFNGN